MAFDFKWLTRVNQTISPFKAQNPAEGQATGGPTMWMYNASSTGANQSAATVEGANYFLGASGFLGVGDWIICDTNDPNYVILNVTAVTAGTTVTTAVYEPSGSGSGTFTTVTATDTTASATPGTIRSIIGSMSNTNTTMTSGNLVGVRGEVDCVGASGGFLYGVQGKVIPTGTLSGSVWAPAVFGQYNLSGATLNAGQIAAIWGDMGASGGTFTDVTGARMFAGTNTIASLTLNAMIYLYGKASNLFELSGNAGTYITTAAGATPSGTLNKIAITIDGTTFYILAATVYS